MIQDAVMSVAFLTLILSVPSIFILRGPIGRAMADRIAKRGGAADEGRVERLDREVQELRAELGEVHERLDFAERMLTRQRDMEQLPAGERARPAAGET
jgi:hypothetical protein